MCGSVEVSRRRRTDDKAVFVSACTRMVAGGQDVLHGTLVERRGVMTAHCNKLLPLYAAIAARKALQKRSSACGTRGSTCSPWLAHVYLCVAPGRTGV